MVILRVAPKPGEVGASRDLPARYARYFRELGHRIRSFRAERHLSQEDMISYGFSLRHWQMIEAGRPITMFTLLRVCDTFEVRPEEMLKDLGPRLRKRQK